MARNADKTLGDNPGTDPNNDNENDKDNDIDARDDAPADAPARAAAPVDEEPDAIGYKPTRRQLARGDKPADAKVKDGPPAAPPTKYQQFMEEHWDGWLSQVLLIAVMGAGVVAYKMELLQESMIGIVLSGGLVAAAIYATAVPAYDMIKNDSARKLFAALVIIWAIAAGYPTLRKGMSRKVLATTKLTEEAKSAKLAIAEGLTGPFDVTVSGTVKQEAGQNSNIGYDLTVTGDGNVPETVSGEITYAVHQSRVRRGTTSWKEQRNQIEHRLPSKIHGKELTVATDSISDMLQDGLHVTVHPRSYDPNWFFLAGIFVVLCMIFIESRIGDKKNKPHLIMAAAITLVFSYQYHQNATSTRMVAPTLDAVILAAITGGIGGTIIGAIVRKVSGRDRIKPAIDDEKTSEKT